MNDLGTVTTNGEHATLTFERRLPFPIDRVWAAITDPGERRAWLGTTHIEDGEIVIEPEDPPAPPEAKRVTGRILTWQPPDDRGHAVFEHEWRQRIVEDSVVRYELRADGDETLLTFTHRGLSERNALGFVPGTHAFLDRLRARLNGEEPPNWQERYAEVAPAYPAWR